MSKLEDLLPELAGVFAAQESAMENVVSMLTTQVAHLIQENDRQSQQVAALERTQQQLHDALLTMRKAYDRLEDQHKRDRLELVDSIGGVGSTVEQLQAKLEGELATVDSKYESVVSQLATVGAGPSESQVVGLLGDHLASVESKLTAHLEHRVLEVSNRSLLQLQQTEEAVKTEVEMLEKKVDYLSRVKMEIKDLGRKIDKQDQTLDDMRMGMELLAKTIGTDEDDESESDHTDHDDEGQSAKPLRLRVDKAEVMNVMKRISLSSSGIQAKIDKNAAALLADAAAAASPEPVDVPPPPSAPVGGAPVVRSKSLSASGSQQAFFSRSKSVGTRVAHIEALDPPPVASGRESSAQESTPSPREEVSTEDSVAAESAALSSRPPPPEDTVDEESANEPPEVVIESPSGGELSSRSDAVSSDVGSPTSAEVSEELTQAPAVAESSLEDDHPAVDAVPDPTPEKSPEEVDTALEEAEQDDQVVEILPSQTSRPRLTSRELLQQPPEDAAESKSSRAPAAASATMQHMPTAPNLTAMYPAVSTASTAMIRSRRLSRLNKRSGSLKQKEPMDSARSESRAPMAKEIIKELWRRMFTRFVQLKRLQMLNGANPERIFRKQNISVGARVKRLEESAGDLEALVDALEDTVQRNSQGVQALAQALAQTQLDLSARMDRLNDDRVVQGQMVVGLEEKLDLIEIDLRRVRGSSRRESSQSVSSTAVTALAAQQQELAAQLTSHAAAFETVERAVKRLSELDLPALATKFETAMRDFRGEQEHKAKELAKDLHRLVDRVREAQTAAQAAAQKRTNGFLERLYRDLMTLSRAHLASLELVRAAKSPPTLSDDGAGRKRRATLFDASRDMLAGIFSSFRDDCTNLRADGVDDDAPDASTLSVLLDRAATFLSELEKLKEQAETARHSPVLALGGDESSANFVDRLALITNAQLRTLESLVDSRGSRVDESEASDDATSSDVSYQVQDLVVQLRAVSSLLALHSELLDPHQQLRVVLSAHGALQQDVRAHDYSIAQFGAVEAAVKMMNARLDSLLALTFSFAKDDDVQKSLQEILSSSDSVRDSLALQLEAAHADAQQRDAALEHELTQLVARVNRKLDKDELLWTQEVIERQLQSVAKSSLGESDLLDLHRLLRNKLDKSYFHALLLEQRDRAATSGGAGASGPPGNAPLVGAKCMSCNSEPPPTKAMIASVVKEQVQHEVHKSLARQQQQQSVASPSAFNASTHRSMEKYKKELLAATTPPHKPHARR